jgi:phosphoglycerate dehydrogenase-like enzyme
MGYLNYAEVEYTCTILIPGNWRNKVERGHDPKGKIMGVLGMGDIGHANPHS